MPSKARHEQQAQHNHEVLRELAPDATDWQVTLMMYVALHGCRAYISEHRPGYAGHDLKYDSIQRILQKEVPEPQPALAADFARLVSYSYKTRYHCPGEEELSRMLPDATRRFQAIREQLHELNVSI
ncbi:hypothetical protein [Deinococcus sp. 12RED42]|uniref:hypothetical protein n=1 Tax=Deinococcus sp. 12RED42 TaxID=2745872 RepID=UPI001E5883F3|nr:hypothetical protein [Deinococcus sp. 12RED42]MCD0164236.1 hypothetical protein [Deinococcus sp. 12RED42]